MKSILLASVLLVTVCACGITSCSADVTEGSSVNGEVLGETRVTANETAVASDNTLFEEEPYVRRHSEDGFMIAVPTCFEMDYLRVRGCPYDKYISYQLDEDTKIWLHSEVGGWTEEAPPWMETDNYTRSLEDVPGFMLTRVLDSFYGPGRVDGNFPFMENTTVFNIEDDRYVEIGGTQFIRQEGSATASAYGVEATVYFTVYYGLYERTNSDGTTVYPPFFFIMSTSDGSDEARQYVRETCDYAMTYFYT